MGRRQQYLGALNQPERLAQFIEYNQSLDIDWEAITAKIEAEWEAERARPGAKPFS